MQPSISLYSPAAGKRRASKPQKKHPDTMPYRLIHFVDGHMAEMAGAFLLTLQWCMTYGLLSMVPADRYEMLEWTLLTGFGAASASFVCFCFNPQREVRRIVMGRCVFALGGGIVGARMASMFHPWIMDALTDPFIRIGGGAVLGFLCYILAVAVTRRAYAQSEGAAAQIVQAVQDQLAAKVASMVSKEAAVVAKPIAEKVEAVANALEQQKQQPTQMDANIHQIPPAAPPTENLIQP